MKTNKLLTTLFACALVISACGTDAAAAPADEEISIDQAYTAAAMTLASQQQANQATPTLLPASTPALLPTVTLISMPTATLFQTIQNIASGSTLGGSTGCDSSVYLSDVTIPDGTILTPGESFTKTWSLQNTGSCSWTTSYSIAYYSGNSMSGSATALGDAVSSGGSINASVELVAPSTAGAYTGYWRLQNASGVSFGEAVYVQIVVSGSTATPTATDADESNTSTPTTEATSTMTPTNTPEPTSTPTPIPAETEEVTATS